MPSGVPDELDDDERGDQAGLRAKAATPKQDASGHPRSNDRCHDEQTTLAQQQFDEDAKAREALAEEPGVLPAARRTLTGSARIGKVEWIAERPEVECEQREQPDESARSVCSQPSINQPSAPKARMAKAKVKPRVT